MSLPLLDGATLGGLVPGAAAVEILEAALLSGEVDPESDSPRLFSPAPAGEFLFMPTSLGEYAGAKVVTVAPENPAVGQPKIQGLYVLFEAAHLAPVAVMDAVELTLIRTPAVTTLAIKKLLAADPRGRSSVNTLVVFGTGPQAERHIRCLTETLPVAHVVIIGRRPTSADELVARCRADGIDARPGTVEDIATADVVVCASSSSVPLFDDSLVQPDTIVAAVGSHGLDRREVPAELVRRSDIVVEGRASAMREGGNLIPARSVEEWQPYELSNLADLTAGRFTRQPGRPALYSGVGMAWQDIVVASYAFAKHRKAVL